VVAYVRPRVQTSHTEAEVTELVRDHCAGRLARFKQPGVIRVVDELPHTVTGKVAKGQLRTTGARRNAGLLE
jgi:long-chain acyl-CoA synthetase